jgi:hypothetical protein
MKSSRLGMVVVLVIAGANIGWSTWATTSQQTAVAGSAKAVTSTVATPTVSPGSGCYTGSVKVAMACTTSGATIRYTTNGSDPTSSSSAYSGSITLSSTTTIKAKAFKSGKTNSAVASATYTVAVVPSVTNFTGTPWAYPSADFPYSNPQWLNYLQVGYAGHATIYVYANGSGLDRVTAVSTTASGYAISIVAKSASKLTLSIQGVRNGSGCFDENAPKPVANMPLTFSYSGGVLSRSVSPGIIPAFNPGLQAYGQCTWYAGYIARLRAGKAVVASYSSCVPLSGNPANPGFPKANSVLNSSGKHMSFLESVRSSSTNNADGSVTVTYAMSGSQYNTGTPWGSRSPFTTQMVIRQKSGLYTIVTAPKVIYPVTAVKQ